MKNIVLFPVLLLIGSCALVFDGTHQQVSFDSNEKNVQIYINDKFACQTPCIADVKRGKQTLMVTAKKDGFEERTVFLNRNLNSLTALNLISLWTSTFGFTTDAVAGSFWQYQPNAFYVVMTKEPKTQEQRAKLIEQNKIRDFVLRNFDQLQSDAFENEKTGEYIRALAQMTKHATIDVKSIVQQSYTPADCAERVIGLYLSK